MADYSGKRIYIAEDNDLSFQYLYELLRHTKAEIQHAINGIELLKLMNNSVPDLVLLDIQMPVMNGTEAIVEIRKRYGKDLPVIAQTAHTMRSEISNYLSLGCTDVITKPIKRAKLFEAIDLYLMAKPSLRF